MNRNKRIFAGFLLAAFCLAALSAQVRGALIVQCNVSGAQVFADGRLIGTTAPNFTILMPAKSYTIKVSKNGFKDFVQNIQLTSSGVTVKANLVPLSQAAPAPQPVPQPQTPPRPAPSVLAVNSNIQGAEVLINGNPAGRTPFSGPIAPGTYTITVRAAGFNDFVQTVAVNGQSQVTANLQPKASALTINSNVQNAEVLINGNPAGRTPFTAQLVPGTYNVTVRAPGFNDYAQTVAVNGPSQITANLQPQAATLTINANVAGAEVLINGNPAGRTPFSGQVAPGTYSVTIRTPGYNDYAQTVTVSGPTQVNAILVAASYPFSVDSGSIRGAQVFINGNLAGQTPFSAPLAMGSYSIIVRAPGYADYSFPLNMNGPQNVSAVLSPLMGHWQISIPGLNPGSLRKNEKGENDVQIFIDGNQQRDASGEIMPGRHTLRISMNGLSGESVFDVVAGRNYVFEPFLGITVK